MFDILPLPMILFVCLMSFLAGFVDSVAGGGGCISLPAYLFTGLPPQTAFACNKFSSAWGTLFAAVRYLRNGAVHLRVALISASTAVLGAVSASRIVLMLDPTVFQKILVFVLPFAAVFLLLKRDFGAQSGFETLSVKKVTLLALVMGLVLGFYDGMIGPGTGTFAIAIFSGV
ncbi:MAG: TSUP family transporter, partial [Anaerovoracaceae bacterium]